jgi:hypothetical protein
MGTVRRLVGGQSAAARSATCGVRAAHWRHGHR